MSDKIFVRITGRENFNVSFESMDGKFKETMPESVFSEYFLITNVESVYEMIRSDAIDNAVAELERKTRWLTPHSFNILRLLHKQEKGEALTTIEYSIFGDIVQAYCKEFGETPADFIEAVNTMKRLLQGDK